MPNVAPDSVREHDPLTALQLLAEQRAAIETELEIQVRRARHAGLSWEMIADALGVTRQAVHKKYSGRGTLFGRGK